MLQPDHVTAHFQEHGAIILFHAAKQFRLFIKPLRKRRTAGSQLEGKVLLLNDGGDFADGVIAYEGHWLGAETFVSFDKDARLF